MAPSIRIFNYHPKLVELKTSQKKLNHGVDEFFFSSLWLEFSVRGPV